ncbi:hypothetical protein [uncultured Arcobacter sp.]|uniref:hypothetical protein n=1 Tax=uncultured Arcobacter sp. TaxID=165434 RepID=UPI00262816D7|nr:hypothetical protein [uncultured Arcobacter sp.]
MFNIISEVFNTREIATVIIILVFTIYALSKNANEILKSMKMVIKSFLNIKI